MPNVLQVQAAFLHAADYADRVSDTEYHDVVIDRWRKKAERCEIQAGQLEIFMAENNHQSEPSCARVNSVNAK